MWRTRGVGVLSQERTARGWENSLHGDMRIRDLFRVGLGFSTQSKGGGSGIDSGRPLCLLHTVAEEGKKKWIEMWETKRNKIVFLVRNIYCKLSSFWFVLTWWEYARIGSSSLLHMIKSIICVHFFKIKFVLFFRFLSLVIWRVLSL